MCEREQNVIKEEKKEKENGITPLSGQKVSSALRFYCYGGHLRTTFVFKIALTTTGFAMKIS